MKLSLRLAALVPAVSVMLFLALPGAGRADTCVDCHKDPDFLVTNKKLYDYYQQWQASTHGQEDITCSDCHGGNPKASGKDKAHVNVALNAAASAVNFKNIPKVCGDCHEAQLTAYRKSKHFEHLVKKKQADQGPNCVTCHGSVNARAQNVTTVRDTCTQCHNPRSKNNPEIPLEAESLLNDLNTIRAYNRFIGIRAEPKDAQAIQGVINPKLESLGIVWHTFELKKIQEDTHSLLGYSREKRNQIRKVRKAKEDKK